ncbi:MAG: DUF6036 family nucleotidyltransferase [Gaiellaceae bacterium]
MHRVDADQVRRFMRAAGAAAREDGTCYLTGGATAVLLGWRASTLDIDVRFEPEQDAVMRELQQIKRDLQLNVEAASPAEFIPLPNSWEERSPFVAREGRLTFRHFDLYAQALAKIERGHEKDLVDVRALLDLGYVERETLRTLYDEIEPQLYRFPALTPESFRQRVERATTGAG